MGFWNNIKVEYEEPIKYYDRKNIALHESFEELDRDVDSVMVKIDLNISGGIEKDGL